MQVIVYTKKKIYSSQKTLEEQLYVPALCFGIAAGIFIWCYFQGMFPKLFVTECIWYQNFGIYCPGCGGTRAVKALFEGKFLLSLWYHPLVLYSIVLYGIFIVSQTFAKITRYRYTRGVPFYNWYLYVAVIILAVNFIVKNVLRITANIYL